MTLTFEEIKNFLPQYLSDSAKEALFSGLKDFPENIDSRFYANYLKGDSSIFQGDGISGMHFYSPAGQDHLVSGLGMILSNTCDMDQNNPRLNSIKISYVPIVSLEGYKQNLKNAGTEESINQHIQEIKRQRITHLFYLPPINNHPEAIALLDHACCISDLKEILPKLEVQRAFTLSDLGFYLFLLKLSIHFTRIKEGVCRNSI